MRGLVTPVAYRTDVHLTRCPEPQRRGSSSGSCLLEHELGQEGLEAMTRIGKQRIQDLEVRHGGADACHPHGNRRAKPVDCWCASTSGNQHEGGQSADVCHGNLGMGFMARLYLISSP